VKREARTLRKPPPLTGGERRRIQRNDFQVNSGDRLDRRLRRRGWAASWARSDRETTEYQEDTVASQHKAAEVELRIGVVKLTRRSRVRRVDGLTYLPPNMNKKKLFSVGTLLCNRRYRKPEYSPSGWMSELRPPLRFDSPRGQFASQ
jgi:hypothetical protein